MQKIWLMPLLAATLFCAGCYEEVAGAIRIGGRAAGGGVSAKSYVEAPGNEDDDVDPAVLASLKTVLFIPFEYNGIQEGFDSMVFTTRLANQVATKAEMRVLYPRDVLKVMQIENHRIEQKNQTLAELISFNENLDNLPRDERTRGRLLDPMTQLDDAVRLGRQLKADAVVMGMVSDWSPYMRPRMCVTMRVIATGNSDTVAQAIADLTQSGVPRLNNTARGVVWFIQQNFDARDPHIGRNVWGYGVSKHTEDNVYDQDMYVRIVSNFYDYVGASLGRDLLSSRNKAIAKLKKLAAEKAKAEQRSQEATRNRLLALIDPYYKVPDGQMVENMALTDRRDKGWRPDIYNLQHSDKKQLLNTWVDPRAVEEQYGAMRGNPPPLDGKASDLTNEFMPGQAGIDAPAAKNPLPAGVDF
jgi:hypothetical protein